MSGSKQKKCGVVLKADSGLTWEVIIADGETFRFNVLTWGETTRQLLQPIMVLLDTNFLKIIEETQCYIKVSVKGKEKSTGSGGSYTKGVQTKNLYEFR